MSYVYKYLILSLNFSENWQKSTIEKNQLKSIKNADDDQDQMIIEVLLTISNERGKKPIINFCYNSDEWEVNQNYNKANDDVYFIRKKHPLPDNNTQASQISSSMTSHQSEQKRVKKRARLPRAAPNVTQAKDNDHDDDDDDDDDDSTQGECDLLSPGFFSIPANTVFLEVKINGDYLLLFLSDAINIYHAWDPNDVLKQLRQFCKTRGYKFALNAHEKMCSGEGWAIMEKNTSSVLIFTKQFMSSTARERWYTGTIRSGDGFVRGRNIRYDDHDILVMVSFFDNTIHYDYSSADFEMKNNILKLESQYGKWPYSDPNKIEKQRKPKKKALKRRRSSSSSDKENGSSDNNTRRQSRSPSPSRKRNRTKLMMARSPSPLGASQEYDSKPSQPSQIYASRFPADGASQENDSKPSQPSQIYASRYPADGHSTKFLTPHKTTRKKQKLNDERPKFIAAKKHGSQPISISSNSEPGTSKNQRTTTQPGTSKKQKPNSRPNRSKPTKRKAPKKSKKTKPKRKKNPNGPDESGDADDPIDVIKPEFYYDQRKDVLYIKGCPDSKYGDRRKAIKEVTDPDNHPEIYAAHMSEKCYDDWIGRQYTQANMAGHVAARHKDFAFTKVDTALINNINRKWLKEVFLTNGIWSRPRTEHYFMLLERDVISGHWRSIGTWICSCVHHCMPVRIVKSNVGKTGIVFEREPLQRHIDKHTEEVNESTLESRVIQFLVALSAIRKTPFNTYSSKEFRSMGKALLRLAKSKLNVEQIFESACRNRKKIKTQLTKSSKQIRQVTRIST